jgi:hypothetical protein
MLRAPIGRRARDLLTTLQGGIEPVTQPMQDCPSCGNEIPVSATRCKHCFHDLSEDEAPKKSSGALMGVLVMLLVFIAVGGWMYQSVFNTNQLGNVTIDPKEQRVVLVYTALGEDPSTRQIPFDDVASVEMQAGSYLIGGFHYEVYLVLRDGDKVLINKSTGGTLEDYANTVAKHTNKSLTIINNVRMGQDMRGFDGGAANPGGDQ